MEIEPPIRLGYFLEFTEPRQPYFVCGRLYRGIDRTIAYMDDDFEERAAAHSFPPEWDSYWDAEEEHGVLTEADVARRCRDGLLEIGVANEVVYAEMVAFPHGTKPFHDPRFFERRHELIRRPDAGMRFLGHDVSGAEPTFHSYLMNPGLDRRVPDLSGLLNEHALVSDRDVAERLMHEAHAVPYWRVPAVIEVWLVE